VTYNRQHLLDQKNAVARAFREHGRPEIACSIEDCGESELLVFCSSCSHRWYVTNHCRRRICPLCDYHLSIARAKWVLAMCREMSHPKLVTLTMPRWRSDPGDGITHLRRAFARLRRHTLWRRVRGGCYQIELIRKTDGWHIHLHALCEAQYIPRQRLYTAWRTILALHYVSTDVRAATTRSQQRYACKYVSKAAKLDDNPDDIIAWYDATRGKRLWATFGTWYNITPASIQDDPDRTPYVPTCPQCGATHSTIYARDGPYVLGHDTWDAIRPHITNSQWPIQRAITYEETSTCSPQS